MKPLYASLAKQDPTYEAYLNAGRPKRPSAQFVLSWILPCVTSAFWLFLVWVSLGEYCRVLMQSPARSPAPW